MIRSFIYCMCWGGVEASHRQDVESRTWVSSAMGVLGPELRSLGLVTSALTS